MTNVKILLNLEEKIVLNLNITPPQIYFKKYLKKFGFLKYNYKIRRTKNERKQHGK